MIPESSPSLFAERDSYGAHRANITLTVRTALVLNAALAGLRAARYNASTASANDRSPRSTSPTSSAIVSVDALF